MKAAEEAQLCVQTLTLKGLVWGNVNRAMKSSEPTPSPRVGGARDGRISKSSRAGSRHGTPRAHPVTVAN